MQTTTDILDDMGNNATASLMLNEHHAVVGERDEEGYLDNCERCGFATGWLDRSSLGPDVWGHTTAADSADVAAWIARQA